MVGPGDFKLKIAHLSDLHHPYGNKHTDTILTSITEFAPDYIFLTGDIIDEASTLSDIESVSLLIHKLAKIAFVFAISGNHEASNPNMRKYITSIEKAGATYLENIMVISHIRQKRFIIAGLLDNAPYESISLTHIDDTPIILLSHRPSSFNKFASATPAPTIVFAGHAHGGVVRLFGHGLYTPDQGFMPQYTRGIYQNNGSAIIVS
ncbi:MAG: metallophosphoesterase, partial [Christensenellaceae bacterium]|nr:metallophosphoesterase [Christensenellaceae bacterium]